MNITKDETLFLKGMALVLMQWHHLFGVTLEIDDPSRLLWLFGHPGFEVWLAGLGKICVPAFLFLSGYGLAVSGKKATGYYFRKIGALYRSYWLVFFLFIPVALLFFGHTERYEFNGLVFLENLLALRTSYNLDWWFVETYVLLLLLMPLIQRLRGRPVMLGVASFLLFGLHRGLGGFPLNELELGVIRVLYWQPVFVLGYLCGTRQGNPAIMRGLALLDRYPTAAAILSAVAIPVLYDRLHIVGLMLATPAFVVLGVQIYRRIPARLAAPLISVGTYSMFMWLTHSFYCRFLWPDLIFWPRSTPLILLNLLLVSYLTSRVLTMVSRALALWTSPPVRVNSVEAT